MDPATISLILSLVVKYGPTFVMDLMEVLHKKAPQDSDWQALKDRYAGHSFEDYQKGNV